MENDCANCVYCHYEEDVNYLVCNHPDYDEETDVCPGRYSIEDARADARYKDCEKY